MPLTFSLRRALYTDGAFLSGVYAQKQHQCEEYELGPDGPDEYRCFVLPTDLPEDQWVVAVEHQHHLILPLGVMVV